MKLNSSDGTNLTVEQLTKVRNTLGDCFERIIEINNSGIQFDYCTSSELTNAVDSINDIMKRITKFVYQD